MSAISEKYASLGGQSSWLGAPEAPEAKCPDGVGSYQHYKGGASIYWTPSTGAHLVYGLIRAKWAKLGWERSPLGYPTSDEEESPSKKGRYNTFQHGAILWKTGAKEAFEAHGRIRAHWGAFNYENGFLGFPTTDETKTPDGIGRFNHFEHGSIYWKPSIDAHEIHGLIRQYWAEHGWEKNKDLGYPISDEQPTQPGSHNRYSDFENGILFWKFGAKSAIQLSKFTIDNASQGFSAVSTLINKKVRDLLTKADSNIYIKSGPTCSGVTDYFWGGNTVQNRNYKIAVSIGYSVSGTADPYADMTFNIQLYLDKSKNEIVAFLTAWHTETTIPFPTSIFESADDFNAKMKNILDPMLWVPNLVANVPEDKPFNFLSAKTMPNGDLNIYVEPLA